MDRRPVLIGAGQWVQHEVDLAKAPTPLDALETVARRAAEDARIREGALGSLDLVALIDTIGWWPRNGPGLLAERLGAVQARSWISGIGGEIPLVVLEHMAREIAAGNARFALLGGTHHMRTGLRAQAARHKLEWPQGGSGEPQKIGKKLQGNSEAEAEYGLGLPTDVYPLFENALRARRGLGISEHQLAIGRLMSGFTRVAAGNPYAWFPVERSPEEITTVSERNRLVSFPYTKYMNAMLETDQAAALLICSADAARELGVPEERWIWWRGGASGVESRWYPSEREDIARCPSMGETARAALGEAGIGVDELAAFDFYSCFPIAVEHAIENLGLAEDDPRGFTTSGGLPYAGGPGNNYTLHSTATMLERLRANPGAHGLVTGNGWYLTKHSANVLSGTPPQAPPATQPVAEAQPDVAEGTASTEPVEGAAHVETYTVVYDREGAPARGIVVGRTEAGTRFLANTPEDRALLEAFVTAEQVGSAGRVQHRDGRNVFEPA